MDAPNAHPGVLAAGAKESTVNTGMQVWSKGWEQCDGWEAVRVWVVQSGEEQAPGTPYCSLSVPTGSPQDCWRGILYEEMG